MFSPYRRHESSCKHAAKGRGFFRCGCPVYADNNVRGTGRIVKSVGTRNWEEAQKTVLGWDSSGTRPVLPAAPAPPTVAEAIEFFKRDLAARQLKAETIAKYELMFRGLRAFAKEREMLFVTDLGAEALGQFRAGWKDRNLTAAKKLDRLKAFANFGVAVGWFAVSPAKAIRPGKFRVRPTMPYTDEEMTRMLESVEVLLDEARRQDRGNLHRARALVLFLRFSGLRIGDATSCAVERLAEGKLRLYTQKTGQHVHVALPDFVVRILATTPRMSERFWFWSGNGTVETAAKHWHAHLRAIGKRARIERCSAHRFRDTFAVKLLLEGVSTEQVAILLGHSSIRITEKHYSPWIKERQDQAEASVRRAWQRDPLFLLLSAPEGKPQ